MRHIGPKVKRILGFVAQAGMEISNALVIFTVEVLFNMASLSRMMESIMIHLSNMESIHSIIS